VASNGGKGSRKRAIIKRLIQEIAKMRGLSKHQFYKVTDLEIWTEILDRGYDRYIARQQIKNIRLSLPKGYYNKYWE